MAQENLKDVNAIVTRSVKRKHHVKKTPFLTEQVSALIEQRTPPKYKDLGTSPRKDPQRRLNPTIKEVVKNEVLKLLDAGIIYPIANSKWVNAPFEWTQDCQEAFKTLIDKLTSAPIMQPLDWTLPFEIMCDARDFTVLVVLGKRREGKPFVIYYAKFDITIKDKKGVENVVAGHLSRLTFEDTSDHLPIRDDFPHEHLFSITFLPWFAYIVNYMATGEIPVDWSARDKRKFMIEVHNFYWDDLFICKYYPDQILKRCIFDEEIASILEFCHFQACGVDYVSKGVETTTFRSNDNRMVIKFVKENVLSRFGTPHAIISGLDKHFCNRSFEALMKKYGVKYKISTAYHPQTIGQVELANREIKQILEKRINPDRKDWSLRLVDVLWVCHTAFNTPLGMSHRLVSEKPCHLPVELEHRAYWVIKHFNFDMTEVVDKANGLIGIGVAIRDCTGQIIATMRKRKRFFPDPLLVESYGALQAVKLGLDLGLQHIVIEGESLQVTKALLEDKEA
ncbi:uncharacterized protein LOC121242246 [Juglans microcarpa x Juglans regia]|uniref:uncharacterized protein LOC121242246 n=1 Tax=Juglans microcarpa x Juglans regia TaxID=2249226 RepID=UPI001B7F26E6|nr:uncharacterized protein LOC121242246 [Juglans microcarpa x Juglans regia]